ncbi:MAG: class I SAM-dependent RNA methyltransferase [Betaproteobacteria bacterium]|nr:class I SAM-dependent RNA methyltransferase [Betaproteobacteria bacterium]MDH5220052.1 class I SAM-dependent RNA methyltransferase [Betaproteobacteria bacterium]MDH5349366.1 class I SAM-dependent RNA methyltransferase [Betaproteobacteria bacterium]
MSSSSRAEAFFAPCPRGLEGLLADELRALGAADTRATAGGVAFAGGWDACYRANLWSRLASRVLWRVAEFDYAGEDDVYAAARGVNWFDLFDVNRTLRVYVTAQKSPLQSLEFVTLRVKDAVCDRFRDDVGRRPDVDRADPDVRVHVFLEEKRGMLYLDTSGEPLFKRGWRMQTVEAPLRENLAAGIVMLTGWKFGQPLLDPMCGGATLLIEAAAMARGRAPGLKRAFGFEKLDVFDGVLWKELRQQAAQPAAHAPKLALFGSDADAGVLTAARRNLAAAGVERWVTLEAVDLLRRMAPADSGVMIANPPYGERIGEAEELARFYPKLGDALKKNFAGWNCFFFTADRRMERLIRLQPSRRTVLYNGPLECRLYEFRMVAGSHRS